MAKKKNISKKHKFKHVDATALEQPAELNASSTVVASPRPQAAPVAVTSGRDFSYVAGDLRRIALLGGSLVVIELILYYVLVHTVFGLTVYSLVKI